MADIFISYAREDSERIKLLASGLASHGRSVFWDRTIPPGKTWRNWIGKALAEARCVVVAWSEASIHSEWVCEEAEEGKERNILVPVFLGNVRPPMGFRAIQGATLVDWNGELDDQSFQHLANAVADVLGPVESVSGNNLQRISSPPVVSTPPVDLQIAETTPGPTAAQSVETPGEAKAGQLRETSRDRGHRWPWIVGALLLPVLYAVWEFAIPPKPASLSRQPTMGEQVDPWTQQEPRLPALQTVTPVAPSTPSPKVIDSGAEVRELLNAAERDLADQRLTSPQSSNAVEKYRRVLVLDPSNENAKGGLARVVEKYREMFETKLETGDLIGARKPLNQAAKVLPESKAVNEMRDRLKLAEAQLAKRSEEKPVVSAPTLARDQHAVQKSRATNQTPKQAQQLYGLTEPVSSAQVQIRKGTSAPNTVRSGDTVKVATDYSLMMPPSLAAQGAYVEEGWVLKKDGTTLVYLPLQKHYRATGGWAANASIPIPKNAQVGTYVVEHHVQVGTSYDTDESVFIVVP